MGLTNVTRLLALAGPPPLAPPISDPDRFKKRAESAQAILPPDVVVLKRCRCMDCRNFSQVGGDYFCSQYIGGTAVVWATGERVCDPPTDAWHYCAGYRGPQISKDVWLWPRRPARRSLGVGRSRHVPPGSTIAPEVEQPYDHPPACCEHQTGQHGQGRLGTPPALVAEDRGGNGRQITQTCLPSEKNTNPTE